MNFNPYIFLQKKLFVDLDGTLFNNYHRKHLMPADTSDPEKWVDFNNACLGDELIIPMLETVQAISSFFENKKIIVVTARGDKAREKTYQQLERVNFTPDEIIMRPMSFHGSNVSFKRDVFLSMGMDKSSFLFEDDIDIINMARDYFGCVTVYSPLNCSSIAKGVVSLP